MPVFRWGHTFDAFRDLEREMDRLLRSVNQTFGGWRVGGLYPPLNVYELEDEYLVLAQLPGMSADELELSVANGTLTMKGQRSRATEVPEERYRRSERVAGTWERQLALPARVREDDFYAEFHQGILKLHLPKAPQTQARQIPISS